MDYILLTAAYNEENNIKKVLTSVVNQIIIPFEWIIISDGSTDKTDEIIKDYAKQYPFIKYYRKEKKEKHSFGAKVRAINYGLERISSSNWNYLGILDADVSFQNDYFRKLEQEFINTPSLGLCGGHIIELFDGKEIPQKISFEFSVAGAVQFFRKECWTQIGEFIPLPYGSEDAAAEIIAKSNGWKVRTITDLKVFHYGYVGEGSGNIYKAKIRRGKSYYHLGYHPLFEFARCLKRVFLSPIFIGSILEFWGFIFSYISNERRLLPDEIRSYLRKEQINRLFGRN